MMKNYLKLFEGKSFILKSVLTGISFINCVGSKCVSLMNPREIILFFFYYFCAHTLSSVLSFSKEMTSVCSWVMFPKPGSSLSNFWENPKAFSHFVCLGLGWTSQMSQTVKNLPEMQETQVQSLGWEDPLTKVRVKVLSCLWLFETPWTIQSLEFSTPEYWSG